MRKAYSFMHPEKEVAAVKDEPQVTHRAVLVMKTIAPQPIPLHGEFMDYTISADRQTAGYSGSAAAGDWGLAACRGGRVKGGIGCMLALCEIDDNGNNKNATAVIVDGETVKADTWYRLENGELVEC